jgi:hypothetical protein
MAHLEVRLTGPYRQHHLEESSWFLLENSRRTTSAGAAFGNSDLLYPGIPEWLFTRIGAEGNRRVCI